VPDNTVPLRVQIEYLLWFWARRGSTRHLAPLGLQRPFSSDEVDDFLAAVAAAQNRRGSEGAPDLDAAATRVVAAFRAGTLGRYTLDDLPAVAAAPTPATAAAAAAATAGKNATEVGAASTG
jgi:IS4 transposase